MQMDAQMDADMAAAMAAEEIVEEIVAEVVAEVGVGHSTVALVQAHNSLTGTLRTQESGPFVDCLVDLARGQDRFNQSVCGDLLSIGQAIEDFNQNFGVIEKNNQALKDVISAIIDHHERLLVRVKDLEDQVGCRAV